MSRGKLLAYVAVRIDDHLREAIDGEQRRRERELGVPLTRALTVRLLLEEALVASASSPGESR